MQKLTKLQKKFELLYAVFTIFPPRFACRFFVPLLVNLFHRPCS